MERFLTDYGNLGWLLLTLGPLLFIQRWLQREIQAVFLLLTRRLTIALSLFSLLFLPGVFLHEFSHWLMAQLLRVRTGRFSLLPRRIGRDKLRLGYVETEAVDFFREALIGAAPLISGSAAVAYLGMNCLGVDSLTAAAEAGNWAAFWQAMGALPQQADFWLWFYLAFTISSTMFPSESDRRAWLPVLLVVGVLFFLALAVGAGPWMAVSLKPWFDPVLRTLATIYGISLGLHLALLLPFCAFHWLLTSLTGLRIESVS